MMTVMVLIAAWQKQLSGSPMTNVRTSVLKSMKNAWYDLLSSKLYY